MFEFLKISSRKPKASSYTEDYKKCIEMYKNDLQVINMQTKKNSKTEKDMKIEHLRDITKILAGDLKKIVQRDKKETHKNDVEHIENKFPIISKIAKRKTYKELYDAITNPVKLEYLSELELTKVGEVLTLTVKNLTSVTMLIDFLNDFNNKIIKASLDRFTVASMYAEFRSTFVKRPIEIDVLVNVLPKNQVDINVTFENKPFDILKAGQQALELRNFIKTNPTDLSEIEARLVKLVKFLDDSYAQHIESIKSEYSRYYTTLSSVYCAYHEKLNEFLKKNSTLLKLLEKSITAPSKKNIENVLKAFEKSYPNLKPVIKDVFKIIDNKKFYVF